MKKVKVELTVSLDDKDGGFLVVPTNKATLLANSYAVKTKGKPGTWGCSNGVTLKISDIEKVAQKQHHASPADAASQVMDRGAQA